MRLTNNAPYLLLPLLGLFCAPALACEIADFEQLAADSPHGVTLTSANPVDEAVGYCQLEGIIANADDGESKIRFRLRLPDATAWNGRFLVSGNGGTAGMFQSGDRVQVALQLGYATGQTDTGHVRGAPEDWVMKETESGDVVPNNVTIHDFGHRAIHLTTVVGKQFVDAFYARPPEFSYYLGCSTGGRQGLQAMQTYPNDYDGIIAGAPVFSLTRLNMSQVWTAQQVARLNADAQPLADEQLGVLKEAALGACDALDGLEDRLIDDPRQCGFDPAVLECGASELPPQCLTEPQVDFVSTIYQGPVTAAGERIYPGRLPGGEAGGGMAGWQAFLRQDCTTPEGSGRCDYVARAWHQDPDMDLLQNFSIDDPEDVAAADSSYYSGVTRADNPDVTPFVQSGGKAILYHGWSDTNVTPTPTVELYEAMESTVNRKRGASDFHDHVRLFMAPGMGHCGRGDGPNVYMRAVIEAIDAWVTEDLAPETIVATHEERGMSRPWCPYPQVARLRDSGLNPNNAANFQCVSPAE